MVTWEHFIYFAVVALLLWIVGASAAWRNKVGLAYTTTALGLLAFFSFILLMWISLGNVPRCGRWGRRASGILSSCLSRD